MENWGRVHTTDMDHAGFELVRISLTLQSKVAWHLEASTVENNKFVIQIWVLALLLDHRFLAPVHLSEKGGLTELYEQNRQVEKRKKELNSDFLQQRFLINRKKR